jgi:hypothetical protein
MMQPYLIYKWPFLTFKIFLKVFFFPIIIKDVMAYRFTIHTTNTTNTGKLYHYFFFKDA